MNYDNPLFDNLLFKFQYLSKLRRNVIKSVLASSFGFASLLSLWYESPVMWSNSGREM